jgi:hypothetical protein
VARGGLALLAAQLVIVAGQVIYSAISSRVFGADVFGNFTVGITATGLLTLLLTTGLPSFALASRALNGSQARALVVLAAAGGLTAALLMVAGASVWASTWNAVGSIPMTRTLALQVLLAGPAAVQLALLRREGRPTADAMVQSISAVLGVLSGVAALLSFHEPLALVVNPIVTAFGPACRLGGDHCLQSESEHPEPGLLGYHVDSGMGGEPRLLRVGARAVLTSVVTNGLARDGHSHSTDAVSAALLPRARRSCSAT